MTDLEHEIVKEVIRLLPVYSKTLDFDIVLTAYHNVLSESTEIEETENV